MSLPCVSFTDDTFSFDNCRLRSSKDSLRSSRTSSINSRDESLENESILKSRIKDLEARVSSLKSENEKFADLKKEFDSLQLENNISNRNCEILQGNVETLKVLCNQLATQLEESRARVQILEYRLSCEGIKKEVNYTKDIEKLKDGYISRISEMEKAMQRSQKACEEIASNCEQREIIQDLRIRNLENEKDSIINKLHKQNKTLQSALDCKAGLQNKSGNTTVKNTNHKRSTQLLKYDPRQLFNHSKSATNTKKNSTQILNFTIFSKDLIAAHEDSLSSFKRFGSVVGVSEKMPIVSKYDVEVIENADYLSPIDTDHYYTVMEEKNEPLHTKSWAYALDGPIFMRLTFETFRHD